MRGSGADGIFFGVRLFHTNVLGVLHGNALAFAHWLLVHYRLTDKLMKGKQVGAACETEPPVEGVYQRVATELRGKTGVVG